MRIWPTVGLQPTHRARRCTGHPTLWRSAVGDVLLALSLPVLVFGGGIYAACDCWWRRGHPAPPSPYTHRAARLAEREMLLLAEEIVDDAHAALSPLYDAPGPCRHTAA
ncbi:hypothetical protein SGR_4190 [Streptomyces griseus subsp. griseus NBRC 13350]|uniref:Uncharacterized protein n=1 Tax=Streptomyces griseus subsp. griseus (strain JCM 4626 / CBS 651.72 / NBRC 13350 / KCC S-0626 / ISP 5235) TaxID=455632 RepID=B1VTC9_STRGG|nr:hypothetical protein SGR_4190 [Streptomyces griseus subsp. griseus NBRC 13350]